MNILLTDYNNLFTRDWFLPTGDLRDEKRSYKRSQVIVVTKCKKDLSGDEKKQIIREIQPLENQGIFFSSIEYGNPYHIIKNDIFQITNKVDVLLVTGIANPEPLKKWLNANSNTYYELSYSDHHIFSIDDLKSIIGRYQHIEAQTKIILTTEKDAVRLMKFSRELAELPFYVMPIQPSIMFNEEKHFTDLIVKFISEFKFQS
jgi:tetraacyldisaccharide 4'-kinase